MKILHLTQTDGVGGAAIAARRIHEAQRQAGLDSRMMVLKRTTEGAFIDAPLGAVGRARVRVARLVAKRAGDLLHRSEPGMRSLGLVPSGLGARADQSDADILHLHWLGGETMSLGEIGRLRKPVVWTLHDLWPVRGAEHYGDGPPEDVPGIDGWAFRRKAELWRNLHPILICPSRWIAEEAARSPLFPGAQLDVIPNTLDPATFKPPATEDPRSDARSALGLPKKGRVLLFGAEAAERDTRKGFDLLAAALDHLHGRPECADISLAIFGSSDGPQVAGFPTYRIGRLSGDAEVARAYTAADAFVAPSRVDNLPNTVLEAQFSGLPTAAFRIGGMPDMILNGETGFLAPPFEMDALATAILRCLEIAREARPGIRQRAIELFGPDTSVQRHVEVYDRLVDANLGSG